MNEPCVVGLAAIVAWLERGLKHVDVGEHVLQVRGAAEGENKPAA